VRRSRGPALRLLHQSGHCVDQVHRVPPLGQPEGIGPCGPAHVQHFRGRRRRVPLDQLAGADLLQLKRAMLQARFLRHPLIVVHDGWLDTGRRLGHSSKILQPVSR
jgi:hypothetical protein